MDKDLIIILLRILEVVHGDRVTLDTIELELEQKLADLEKGREKQPEQKEEPFYYKEGWKPKDYNELQKAIMLAEEMGEKRTLKHLKDIEDTIKNLKNPQYIPSLLIFKHA